MSGFGSKTTSKGEEINEGFTSVITGERVVGNKFLSFDFAKDRETGEVLYNKAEFRFEQGNGAIFAPSFLDSTEEWSIDRTNAQLFHMFNKVVTKEEYYTSIEGANSFTDFITALRDKLAPKMEGKSFTIKIVLQPNKAKDKWYSKLPNLPKFFELDGTSPSTINPTNPKYDIYVRPVMNTPEASDEPKDNSEGNMPF